MCGLHKVSREAVTQKEILGGSRIVGALQKKGMRPNIGLNIEGGR